MPTITCKVPEKLDAALKAMAREQGVSKSEFVRSTLKARVANRPRRKPSVRPYDLIKHLAGSVKGGPPDILTNPKYMEGFGE
ncbi:MAG TPA: ribbon-helix-helix domain-containing protein [Tepidisphaeraceae bacterium]|jgi:hypothetical protein|nr:ribbon-helix-helix domain-containing protein [Tepidisphaeraceae bacterium]